VSDLPAELSKALTDHYRLTREVGKGGMSRVYLADDLKHDRQVAIKVLKSEFGAMLGAERFLSEIKVTARLQHPNLLPLFDSGEAAGRLYYVMPYIEGETLRERVKREGPLSVDEVARLVSLIAGALDFAHARGVVHRDLKPENILLQAGQPVISDFGIALAVRNSGGKRITQSGFTLGTPEYMSPEQAAGDKEVDARSDQYALAVLAYEMLSGQPPHHGATAQVIINRVVSEPARSLRPLRPDLSPAMDEALLRALAKDPAARFPSCGDLARAMDRRSGPDPATDGVRERWSLLTLLALGLLAAAGLALWCRPG
jgi:serine/threonine-protein kinase